MLRIASILLLALLSSTGFAMDPAEEESQYDNYIEVIKEIPENKTLHQQKLFEEQAFLTAKSKTHMALFAKAFSEVLATQPEKADALRLLRFDTLPVTLHLLLSDVAHMQSDVLMEIKVYNQWKNENSDLKITTCALRNSKTPAIQNLFEKYPSIQKDCSHLHSSIRPPSPSQIRDLVSDLPDARSFRNGRFYKKPVVYQFCRTHRNYPCLQLIKDGDGRWVRNRNGSLWSQGKLSLSRLGREYNQFNGETPAGIYTLDGVMPEANKQHIYGRYRRLIMTFIPESNSETIMKSLLPPSSYSENWWKEAMIARDMGRSALRIHGTLRRNDDKSTSYYPYYPTFGCVASLETEYDGVDYIDQRHLLDQLMHQQGLQPIYKNETLIRARFYVIEINDRRSPVTLDDLKSYGVE